MTLQEGMRKVLELLDEYTSGGEQALDEDIAARLPDLFDVAQKRLAQKARIVREHTVEREPGVTEYELPGDLMKIYRVWRNGRPYKGYGIRGNRLQIPEEDRNEWTLEYFAVPATITKDTGEDEEFELCEEACQCMPFFVAGMVLSSDLVQDANIYLALYNQMVAELDTELPGSNIRARQSFYRGRN